MIMLASNLKIRHLLLVNNQEEMILQSAPVEEESVFLFFFYLFQFHSQFHELESQRC